MKRVEWQVDGETVRGHLHEPPTARVDHVPLVVMSHGMSSSQVEFYDFPEKVAAAGYAVLTFDWRGHGQSDGERGVVTKDRVVDEIRAGIETMHREYRIDTRRVALLGHSLGGAMVLHAAPLVPDVRCVVALAPVARLKDEMNPFEYVGYNVARAVNLPVRIFSKTGLKVPYKVDYNRLYATPAAVERARRDKFLQKMIPVKNYRPLVRDLNGVAAAENVHLPTLVMVAQYDVVVGKYNSRRVFEALPSKKKFIEVPKSGHSMCGDARSDFVAKHVVEFLDHHVKGVPAA